MQYTGEIEFNKSPPSSTSTGNGQSPPSNKASNLHKLDVLIDKGQKILYQIKSQIPLNPFPDEITISITKVDIIYRIFFWSKEIHTTLIKDVVDVIVETSPIFATLELVDRTYTENTLKVKFLGRAEAKKAQQIIQGLQIARNENLDLGQIPADQLTAKLVQIGTSIESS